MMMASTLTDTAWLVTYASEQCLALSSLRSTDRPLAFVIDGLWRMWLVITNAMCEIRDVAWVELNGVMLKCSLLLWTARELGQSPTESGVSVGVRRTYRGALRQGSRTSSRTRALIACKLGGKFFACPWEFWRATYGPGISHYYYYYYYTLCMSPVTGISSWYFSWTSGDPHRSRFKLHIAVLSVLCVMFQV